MTASGPPRYLPGWLLGPAITLLVAAALFQGTDDDAVRLALVAVTAPAVVWMVTSRRKRVLRGSTPQPVEADSSRRAAPVSHERLPEQLHVALTDIASRKRAEDQLRQVQAQQRTVLAALPVAVLIADARGRIVESNAAARTLWGTIRWPENLDQLDQMKARHPDTGAPLQRGEFPLLRTLATGEPVLDQVLEIEAQTGLRRTVLCSAVPLRDGSEGTGAVLVQIDLTERRQLEDQLRRVQRMDALRRLANGVAHDFNNQLTVISGHTERLMERMAPTDPVRTTLGTILETAHHAAALTRQLQAISHTDRSGPRNLDLRQVLNDLEPVLRHLAGESISLSVGGGAEPCPVHGDLAEVEQVFMNLATRDALSTGGTLRISLRRTPADEVEIEAVDSGQGQDSGSQARPVAQKDGTRGACVSAVGASARRLGGRVEVGGAPGDASVLRVILPAAPKDAPAERPAGAASERTGETILLAEDEQRVRELTTELLRMRGYHVLTARNGAEALLLSARHQGPIQLLLSDVFMPDLRGEELARRLTAERPELRVVLVTGRPQAELARATKVAEVLAKPFTAHTLERSIRRTLDRVADPVA